MLLRGRLESTENERNEANKSRADAERYSFFRFVILGIL